MPTYLWEPLGQDLVQELKNPAQLTYTSRTVHHGVYILETGCRRLVLTLAGNSRYIDQAPELNAQ